MDINCGDNQPKETNICTLQWKVSLKCVSVCNNNNHQRKRVMNLKSGSMERTEAAVWGGGNDVDTFQLKF